MAAGGGGGGVEACKFDVTEPVMLGIPRPPRLLRLSEPRDPSEPRLTELVG